jgi:hypothetical protein
MVKAIPITVTTDRHHWEPAKSNVSCCRDSSAILRPASCKRTCQLQDAHGRQRHWRTSFSAYRRWLTGLPYSKPSNQSLDGDCANRKITALASCVI